MKIGLISFLLRRKPSQTANVIPQNKRFGVMDRDIEDIQKSTLSPKQRDAFAYSPVKNDDKIDAIMDTDID